MHLSFKESFFKIFAPVIGLVPVFIILNLNSLTFTKFIEILFVTLAISFIGAVTIYIFSKLYDPYEQSIINKISTRYNGEILNENTVRIDYKKIVVFFDRRKNIILDQSEFSFHVPRKYLRQSIRKKIKYLKPSNVLQEECFQLKTWLYITERRLIEIEILLDEIANLNIK